MKRRRKPDLSLPVIGWREWVGLPLLSVDAIKVKVDSGARTSSLHAFHVERFRKEGGDFVRFQVHPLQRRSDVTIECVAPLLDYREIRSSNGAVTQRAVISTQLALLDELIDIELSLTRRDQMGFRMLLGREAIRSRFLVDSGLSYCDSSRRPAKRPRKGKSSGPEQT
ncbi:MAG: ATP-dependent zinc protease [Planctomycetaceae bacterium]|nr:ATP-dependent zinc protease [Planctomycetaceae bacterium]